MATNYLHRLYENETYYINGNGYQSIEIYVYQYVPDTNKINDSYREKRPIDLSSARQVNFKMTMELVKKRIINNDLEFQQGHDAIVTKTLNNGIELRVGKDGVTLNKLIITLNGLNDLPDKRCLYLFEVSIIDGDNDFFIAKKGRIYVDMGIK